MTRSSTRTLRRYALPAFTAGLAIVVTACGNGESGSTDADSSGGTPDEVTVVIDDFVYLDDDVTVPLGTTVTFDNLDDAPHTASARDGSFSTGSIGRGEAASVTLTEAGSFDYFCSFHPFMEATITVE